MKSSFLQSPQVLCLEASAGSGKTYALAKRYVQLGLYLAPTTTVPIQSILAITFTNKAAWEMKSRILDFLKRIALKKLKPFEVEDIIKPLGLDENQASSLALRLMNDVIRQYHYFQVQTIDSFVNILLVGCSFKIGLSARFKIKRNSGEYLQLGLDELLDQAGSDEKVYKLFTDFVRQYLFLENRSGWFPREDLLKVVSELFRQYNTYQKPLLVYPEVARHPDVPTRHPERSEGSHFSRKRKIYALMQELRDLCPPQTNKRFLDHLDSLLVNKSSVIPAPSTKGRSPEGQAGIFDVDDLKTYFSREDFPVNKGGVISLQLEGLWQKLSQEIHELCLWEAHSMFNPYVVLFEKLLSCFGQLSKRDDVLFLEELNRKAALLFEDDLVTVEELYFRLAARFQHYLIDEFQDTSLGQWRNLALMVQEALQSGGSLFYVGDKKQAIYAFRGGESRLFDALQIQLADFNVQATSLDKNYRSCPEIIKFNNRVFSLDNLQAFLQRRLEDSNKNKRHDVHFSESDFEVIAHTFANARQWQGNDLTGGVVRVIYLEGRVKQERALQVRQKLIPLIEDLLRRFALKDIAILTRGNDEVEEITQWLLQEGIYASSERSSDIKNNPLMAELMSLLAFLHSPVDNNAFAQFCLGRLMPEATGIGPQALRDFLFDCVQPTQHPVLRDQHRVLGGFFYKRFQEAFPQVWKDFFEDFFLRVGAYPLYELMAGIIQRFGCEKHFPFYQGFFMHLLELVKRQEVESCDLSNFLDYYENLEGEDRFVPMAQVDALKVLTVHKAKGLEFPVVIVPYLEMDIKAGSGGRDGSQAYMLDIQEEGMSLVRLKESYRQFCPELQARYEQEYKKAFLVELNIAYVALTRAIEELYVFVPARVGNSVNPAMFLIPDDILCGGIPAERPVAHELSQVHQKIKPFVSDPWSGLQEEFLNQPAKSAKLARRGTFYHALLMHIGHVNEGNVDQALKTAWDKACHLYAPLVDQEAILADMRGFLNREDVRPFFYLPNKICHSRESGNLSDVQVFCEKEFVNVYGDTKRIDRLIVFKDKVWIVDYKLSPGAEGEHQKQIEGYIELVRQFYPKHKVSGHILYLME
jgi:ATP-dependent exoDNAse (exonuclease V) beta subunit